METVASETTFRSYLTFWSGQLISLLGSSIAQFVIIWWITLETESAVFLSLASFVAFIPQVILTPFAGVLVDRWNRKRVMLFADTGIALVTVVLALLYAIGPRIACGRMAMIEAKASTFAEPVCWVSHHTSENWTRRLPTSEIVCPVKIMKKFLRDWELAPVISDASGRFCKNTRTHT